MKQLKNLRGTVCLGLAAAQVLVSLPVGVISVAVGPSSCAISLAPFE